MRENNHNRNLLWVITDVHCKGIWKNYVHKRNILFEMLKGEICKEVWYEQIIVNFGEVEFLNCNSICIYKWVKNITYYVEYDQLLRLFASGIFMIIDAKWDKYKKTSPFCYIITKGVSYIDQWDSLITFLFQLCMEVKPFLQTSRKSIHWVCLRIECWGRCLDLSWNNEVLEMITWRIVL